MIKNYKKPTIYFLLIFFSFQAVLFAQSAGQGSLRDILQIAKFLCSQNDNCGSELTRYAPTKEWCEKSFVKGSEKATLFVFDTKSQSQAKSKIKISTQEDFSQLQDNVNYLPSLENAWHVFRGPYSKQKIESLYKDLEKLHQACKDIEYESQASPPPNHVYDGGRGEAKIIPKDASSASPEGSGDSPK